jgi:ribonuclease P protein component
MGCDETPSQTLPKSARLLRRTDFDRVLSRKRRASDRYLIVYSADSPVEQPRLGIAASRRLGNAVMRNRAKRLIREAFRRLRSDLPANTDWVVIPKAGTDPGFDQVYCSFRRLRDRLYPGGQD